MASIPASSKCAKCGKRQSDSGVDLKRCAKCRIALYCSRDCQTADWKTHKKVCASNAAGSSSSGSQTTSSTSKGLKFTIDKPFHRLYNKTWMHDRPEEDVFKLLIDTYRLRMEDNFNFEGDRDVDSIYGGAADGRGGFERFLTLSETANARLLPSWWTSEKRAECIRLGLGASSDWSSLARKVTKGDLLSHYGNPSMPMQLRLFGEQVYGRGPGGQKGDMIIMMQMQAEGGSLHSSVLDFSGK